MNTTNPTLLNTIAYYESLLQRYARPNKTNVLNFALFFM